MAPDPTDTGLTATDFVPGVNIFSRIVGASKAAKASREADTRQRLVLERALAEQRRVYDDTRQREDRDRDRENASRQNAFATFGPDLARTSEGYAPALGETAAMRDARNQQRTDRFGARVIPGGTPNPNDPTINGPGVGSGMGDTNAFGLPSSAMPREPIAPVEPQPPVQSSTAQGRQPIPPSRGLGGDERLVGDESTTDTGDTGNSQSALTSTVWLEAPTGEVREVPLQDAPLLLARGAKLLPGRPR